ncbi:GNAT family N-acetyltransferase [Kitasatospora sp. NPDC051853]|uniref:GNAT family N-acetyltransferase n=1 Tax=Kitasatospora sp. NPDC051853 TaxID=3364058 RepID=UPI0037BDB220
MTAPRIRAARADEAGLLSELALRSKAYWGYDPAFMAACRDELTLAPKEIAPRRTAVAVDGSGSVLGFATLEGEPLTGELGMLFVAPEAMGRGVGRLLFEHLVSTARESGFTGLTIDADPNAEAFYRAMGAVRTGSVPSGSVPGRVLPRMLLTVRR